MSAENFNTLHMQALELYNNENYYEASNLFTKCIEEYEENDKFYLMRCLCNRNTFQYQTALEDANFVLENTKNQEYIKNAKLQQFNCLIGLGNLLEAKQIAKEIYKLEKNDEKIQIIQKLITNQNYITKSIEKMQFTKAITYIEDCYNITDITLTFKMQHAQCLIYQEKFDEALDLINDIAFNCGIDSQNLRMRVEILWYQGHTAEAVSDIEELVRQYINDESIYKLYKKMKIYIAAYDKAEILFDSHSYKEAIDFYVKAIKADLNNNKINKKLYYKIAMCYDYLNKINETIDNCHETLKIDGKYIPALVLQAKCFTAKGFYYHAKQNYNEILKYEDYNKYKDLLDYVEMALKAVNNKSPYEILNVDIEATPSEIKKAYYKLARLYHPDKHFNSSFYVLEENERNMKSINEAYERLINENN